MIVRILGEGQYDVSDDAVDRLNDFDGAVEAALDAGNEPAFRDALDALLDGVRTMGVARAADTLDASDLILPHAEASMDEVREMLADDGLIPG